LSSRDPIRDEILIWNVVVIQKADRIGARLLDASDPRMSEALAPLVMTRISTLRPCKNCVEKPSSATARVLSVEALSITTLKRAIRSSLCHQSRDHPRKASGIVKSRHHGACVRNLV
jgi:hypothetical protein